jgi:RNA polymerase sigma factor (sigma-70 family)
MDEGALLQLAAAGNRPAFGVLVRQHQSRLRGFLRRLSRGDQALADDLAQDAFLEAWRKIGQFRGEGSFFSWLAAIAYRLYLMTARRRRLEPLDETVEIESQPCEVSAELRIDLENAMARLPLPERAALTLCYALGYTHEEAAGILAMPLGTVKSHVARGREKLRKLMDVAS